MKTRKFTLEEWKMYEDLVILQGAIETYENRFSRATLSEAKTYFSRQLNKIRREYNQKVEFFNESISH